MVNMRAFSPMPEDNRGNNDVNVMEEMRASVDELHRQNQTLKDNILNIQLCQQ